MLKRSVVAVSFVSFVSFVAIFAVVAWAVLPGTAGAEETTPDSAVKTMIKDISAVEANDYLGSDAAAKDGVVVLDIRTAKEFRDGHLRGARNVNFLAKDFKEKLGMLDRDKVYVMHCQSGGRSSRAKKTFQELGFRKVLHIHDGFNGWAAAGFPVEKGASAE